MAHAKAIAPPEQPKGPGLSGTPQQEHREPAFALLELHRKITVHDEFTQVSA